MREKLATLPLTQLKELAKSQGIKNISGLRKAELIDRLCETVESADSQKAAAGNSENRESTAVPAQDSCRGSSFWKRFWKRENGKRGTGEGVCGIGACRPSGTYRTSGENRTL